MVDIALVFLSQASNSIHEGSMLYMSKHQQCRRRLSFMSPNEDKGFASSHQSPRLLYLCWLQLMRFKRSDHFEWKGSHECLIIKEYLIANAEDDAGFYAV